MVAGVIQHNHHLFAPRTMPQQLLQENLEGLGVEYDGHGTNEFAAAQADGSKASDQLAGRRMQHDRILVLRRHPQATARAMLLEVAFVQTP